MYYTITMKMCELCVVVYFNNTLSFLFYFQKFIRFVEQGMICQLCDDEIFLLPLMFKYTILVKMRWSSGQIFSRMSEASFNSAGCSVRFVEVRDVYLW